MYPIMTSCVRRGTTNLGPVARLDLIPIHGAGAGTRKEKKSISMEYLELYPESVFSVGIRSVFLGIYHTDTEGKLGQYFWYSRYEKVRIYSK